VCIPCTLLIHCCTVNVHCNVQSMYNCTSLYCNLHCIYIVSINNVYVHSVHSADRIFSGGGGAEYNFVGHTNTIFITHYAWNVNSCIKLLHFTFYFWGRYQPVNLPLSAPMCESISKWLNSDCARILAKIILVRFAQEFITFNLVWRSPRRRDPITEFRRVSDIHHKSIAEGQFTIIKHCIFKPLSFRVYWTREWTH